MCSYEQSACRAVLVTMRQPAGYLHTAAPSQPECCLLCRAALCARGVAEAKLNYPLEDYQNELEQLQATLLEDLAAQLR